MMPQAKRSLIAAGAGIALICAMLGSRANPPQDTSVSEEWRFRSPKANEARNKFEAAMAKAREEFAAKAKSAKDALRLDLEKAMKESTQAEDLDEAIRIRSVLRDLAADYVPEAVDLKSAPTGRWTLHYANGVTGTYEFLPGGRVKWIPDRDPRTYGARLVRRDDSLILEHDDGERIERITPCGRRYLIEHWFPKGSYPTVPTLIGVLSRQPRDNR